MTAEVAIFNKSAVALAADSAVSIEGNNSHKIYNNAEKLFALTKHHPVALMIYEHNELQGVPWELIIKSFRKELGKKHFDTLQGYKDAFLSFTREFYINLPSKHTERYLDIYFQDITLLTLSNVFELIEGHYDSGLREIDTIDSVVNMLLDQYQELPYFDGLDEKTFENTSVNFADFAMGVLSEDVDTSDFSDENNRDWLNTCNLFYTLCKLRALKQDPFYKNTTGLVFAGYGDKEYFPVILECEVFGFFHETLKVIRKPCLEGNPSAGLKAFAQRDEVDTFMQGICPPTKHNYEYNISEICNHSTKALKDLIEEHVPENMREEATVKYVESFDNHARGCFEDMQQHTKKQHIDKVVNMIEHLPKNEMAYMAESLVNLTAFKRKVSSESDSVGGPIDVAVISKGDGFVWIKRKHYFPESLNADYGPTRTD